MCGRGGASKSEDRGRASGKEEPTELEGWKSTVKVERQLTNGEPEEQGSLVEPEG